jgi:hypothetical protein
VKSIDKERKKDSCIKFDSNKGGNYMGLEETNKRRDKKMTTTTEKMSDPNRHCKHFDVYGHMEEK